MGKRKSCETLSYGHGMAIVLMNMQSYGYLHNHTLVECILLPVNISSQ